MNWAAPRGRPFQTCIFGAIIAFVNNFYQSYSSFYTNTAAESIQKYLNQSFVARGRNGGQGLSQGELLWLWSLVLNAAIFGNIFGTFCIPILCERAGRKATLLISNCGVFIGVLLSVLSILFFVPELFLFSRVFGAAFANLNFGAFVLFATEFPATNQRGLIVFLGGLFYNVGTNLGNLLGMNAILGQNLLALMGVALIPTFLAILTTIPLKETPKFLLLNREDKQLALESLAFYQGDQIDPEIVLAELLKERQQHDKRPLFHLLKELFLQRHLLLATLLSIASLQLTVGIWPITTTLLSDHFPVDRAQLFSILCTVIALIVNVPATFLAERVSRRSMLLYMGTLNAGCIVAYAICDRITIIWEPAFRYGCVISFFLYFCSFGIALGTIPFYIAGELFPQNFRSIGQSVVYFLSLAISFIFNLFILPSYSTIGVWSFFPLFTFPQIFCLFFLWYFLPETRGREVHQIVEDLKKQPRIATRKVRDSKSSTATRIESF